MNDRKYSIPQTQKSSFVKLLVGVLFSTIDNWLERIFGDSVKKLQTLVRSMKYGVVGGISAITDLAIFLLLISWMEAPWIIALFFSLTTSGVVNFYLTRFGVYHISGASKKSEINGFFIIAGISVLLNYTLFNIMQIINMDLLFTRIVVIALVFGFNFLSREFLYKKVLR